MHNTVKRILHVDDDEELRSLVKTLLADQAEIINAKTLEQARECIEQLDIDLILLDLTLPDGSGLDLLSKLPEDKNSPPVIILSAHDITHSLPRVSAYFIKGRFTREQLVAKVDELTGN